MPFNISKTLIILNIPKIPNLETTIITTTSNQIRIMLIPINNINISKMSFKNIDSSLIFLINSKIRNSNTSINTATSQCKFINRTKLNIFYTTTMITIWTVLSKDITQIFSAFIYIYFVVNAA